jgi:hypothetical protein
VKTLDGFVMGELLSRLSTYKAANAFVRNLVQRALKQLSLGLTRGGSSSLIRAYQAREFWVLDTTVDINERRMMQEFPIMVRDEIEAYMKRPEVAPLYKARLWKNLPRNERQLTYDHLRAYFERLCEAQAPPWDVELAFHEPPDMDVFRQTEIEYLGAPRRKGVEEGKSHKP